jgi:FtsH-binding integral membrane protein
MESAKRKRIETMAYDFRSAGDPAAADVSENVDPGLREYMLRVYNFMAAGLIASGVTGYAAAQTGLYQQITGTPLIWIVMLAPLAAVFFLNFRIDRMTATAAQLAFWIYAVLMGLSLSGIFLAFTGANIARTFFVAAATFGAMSLYGYLTGRDLTTIGSFLFMGLIGILLASVANLFVASPALEFAISVIGVALFVGLTAYDTQRIKEIYAANDDAETLTRKALMGALTLYLDFINLFVMLLHLTGERRS